MTQAKDIMRPVGAVVPVDQPVIAALSQAREHCSGHLVAMDEDEVAGVLDLDIVTTSDATTPELRNEMIGNLVSLTFRTCRPGDDIHSLRRTFERSGAAVIVVTDSDGSVQGLVAPSDVARSPA